ncbi:MAG: MarR family transcriptional regulator [Rhizobiaceae bacterium]|nr:MarR family transcriptional regulator [Rhizobiaceae bacterium]
MTENNTIDMNAVDGDEIENLDVIESLFFAYRDFIEDPDKILAEYGFGRAHHRVLFFVCRQPGLTVAELLGILKITKQSLARVLKQLLSAEYISQIEGSSDRRKRLLYPTQKGRELVLKLSVPQSGRISNALSGMSVGEKDIILAFLRQMHGNKR